MSCCQNQSSFHGGGCSCGSHKCHQCGCQTSCSCGCHSKGEHGGKQGCCDYAKKFLELADEAWMELLKEKIKEHIQSQAKHIDELARLISEANHERWQKKMEDKQCCGSYEQKLKSFFDQACHSGQKSCNQQGNASNKQR